MTRGLDHNARSEGKNNNRNQQEKCGQNTLYIVMWSVFSIIKIRVRGKVYVGYSRQLWHVVLHFVGTAIEFSKGDDFYL